MQDRFRQVLGLLAPLCLFFMLSFGQTACPQAPTEPPTTDGNAEPVADNKPPKETKAESSPDAKVPVGPLDEPLKADETRAGQITKDSERITGSEARSKIGDWRIYNGKVAFALHGVGNSLFFSRGLGQIIDASTVDEKGVAAHDALEEIFPGFGLLRVVRATKIEVLEAGGVGKRAVIRVTATDGGIPVVDEVIKSAAFNGKIEVDYILKPGARYIEIITRLIGGERIKDQQMGDGLLLGDQTRLFGPGVGLKADEVTGKAIPYFASFGRSASYLIAPSDPQDKLTIPLTQASVYPAFGAVASADEDKSEYRRMLFVGDGRLSQVIGAWHELHKTDKRKTVQGQIKGFDKGKQGDIDIFLRTKEGVEVNHTRPDADGNFSFDVPDGTYDLVATMKGRANIKENAKFDGPHTLTFALGSLLKLNIKELKLDGTTGGFIPVRVELRGTQTTRYDLIKDGDVIPVAPGKYTVLASHGLTHEYWQKEITFQADGKTITEDVQLKKIVDTSGYVGADMHLHSTPSVDSELSLTKRVSALATEGLHFAVATDHDTFTDYAPVAKKLGLDNYLRTAIGQEVSLLAFHFNIYPLAKLPTDENSYFGPGWAEYKDREFKRTLKGPELWANIRKKYGVKIIQINHPRSFQSYLSSIGYDAKKGVKAVKDGLFDGNWDAIEVYNGKRRENFLDVNIFDWFSFLNQGFYKSAVGNSDSHNEGSRPGIPRTLIASDTQDGTKIDMDKVAENLKANKALVYAGPMIRVKTPQGNGPGTKLKGKEVTASIEITAPSWISVSYLKIYANGKMLQKIDIPASTDKVRFKQDIKLNPTKDTWYVFLAGDDKKTMTPIYPSYFPVTMTNPIFLDIDGDGFKAPGLETP